MNNVNVTAFDADDTPWRADVSIPYHVTAQFEKVTSPIDHFRIHEIGGIVEPPNRIRSSKNATTT